MEVRFIYKTLVWPTVNLSFFVGLPLTMNVFRTKISRKVQVNQLFWVEKEEEEAGKTHACDPVMCLFTS